MKNKPAELSAGLVAIKGAAAPSPDMPGRAGGPSIAAVPTTAPDTAASPAPEPVLLKAATRPAARKGKTGTAEEKEAQSRAA
jgi:hypothetical protein